MPEEDSPMDLEYPARNNGSGEENSVGHIARAFFIS
jgi:hypothetical protein